MKGELQEITKEHRALAKELVPSIQSLGELSIEFAETYRITYLDTDGTLESDTDHTFMLSVVACSIADRYVPELDVGKVAQFAIVHDFVEVIAGDVPTIRESEVDMKQKEIDESNAIDELESEFGEKLPWIPETIREYESLSTPEARFVKIIDKVMPSITHLHSQGILLLEKGIDSKEEVDKSVAETTARIRPYAYDQPLARAVRDEFVELIKVEIFPDAV